MIDIVEFYADFSQSILVDTESRGLLKNEAFFENVCEELVSIGELGNNYTKADYSKRGIEINGYDYDPERELLTLIIANYFQSKEIEVLTKQLIETKFKRATNFLIKCMEDLYLDLEETSEAYSAALSIRNWILADKVSRIRFILLTDGRATRNLVQIPNNKILDLSASYLVVDIEYLHKIFLSQQVDKGFEIELKVPSLKVDPIDTDYESYLAVLDGCTLAEIYEKFGQRLLEQNVRTFLQFRGKVNKGIRNTIEYCPSQFFAYNNGITATATDLDRDDEGNIIKISNFQIVNGGQTTSAIYAAQKNYRQDISKIFVQMKLSVIKNKENKNDIVAKISEYANTQNKVKKSDFFSNSIFHKEFKDYSNRVWVSPKGGAQIRSRWFYERVRGEYLNQQAYMTKAEKKKFQLENPKSQLIDKTFLAKSENTWDGYPNIVSKGAQYSFASFADRVTLKLEKDSLAITEDYFKDAVSRAILFKKTEKIVCTAKWYDGGYRAQTVTYTLALIAHSIKQKKKFFNFDMIWNEQQVGMDLCRIIEEVARNVYNEILCPPAGFANVGQWCKQTACWDKIKSLDLEIGIPSKYLLNNKEMKFIQREAKVSKLLDSGIEIQKFVIECSNQTWERLFDYYARKENGREITGMQRDILLKMSTGRLYPPTERQSKVLYSIYKKAEEAGVVT